MIRFAPEKLAKYPHMFPEDIAIWERFLEKFGDMYSWFNYDVKVGEGRAINPRWEPEIRRMTRTLTKKRIDAVGHTADLINIFEVKPNAGASAFGQVIAYATLYEAEVNPDALVQPVIVTDALEPDTQRLASWLAVEVIVV